MLFSFATQVGLLIAEQNWTATAALHLLYVHNIIQESMRRPQQLSEPKQQLNTVQQVPFAYFSNEPNAATGAAYLAKASARD